MRISQSMEKREGGGREFLWPLGLWFVTDKPCTFKILYFSMVSNLLAILFRITNIYGICGVCNVLFNHPPKPFAPTVKKTTFFARLTSLHAFWDLKHFSIFPIFRYFFPGAETLAHDRFDFRRTPSMTCHWMLPFPRDCRPGISRTTIATRITLWSKTIKKYERKGKKGGGKKKKGGNERKK